MTIEERAKNIIQDIEMEQGKNPVKIFEETFNTSEMIYGYESDGNFQKVVTSGIAGWGMPVRTDYHSEYVILNIKE